MAKPSCSLEFALGSSASKLRPLRRLELRQPRVSELLSFLTVDYPPTKSNRRPVSKDLQLTVFRRDGWICANPVGVESPGLMTGLAGIGHELLRLAEPDRVPSVLVLEPPPGPCP